MSDISKPRKRKLKKTKDRVLQARIPEHLDDELRGQAEELGLSVSTIVRNVLLHTFNLVEGVVTDSAQIVRAVKGQQTPASPTVDEDNSVIGWQESVLNKNGVCDECNAILPRGGRAAVGVPVQARPTLLCLDCLNALSSLAVDPDPGPASD